MAVRAASVSLGQNPSLPPPQRAKTPVDPPKLPSACPAITAWLLTLSSIPPHPPPLRGLSSAGAKNGGILRFDPQHPKLLLVCCLQLHSTAKCYWVRVPALGFPSLSEPQRWSTLLLTINPARERAVPPPARRDTLNPAWWGRGMSQRSRQDK